MSRFNKIISTLTLSALLAASTTHLHAEGCPSGVCPVTQAAAEPAPAPVLAAEPIQEPCAAYTESTITSHYAPVIGLGAIAVIAIVTLLVQDAGLHHQHGHY